MRNSVHIFVALALVTGSASAQVPARLLTAADSQRAQARRDSIQRAAAMPRVYTHADTLRGSFTTPGRAWWDVAFYDLHVAIDPNDSSIGGYNGISYRVLKPATEMQIDLMTPLEVDSMVQDGRAVRFRRDSNAFFATLAAPQRAGEHKTITVYYHGKPRVATNPPWQGGFTWTKDSLGRPWVVTTDQGMGASVWWPNKDTQADEPDSQRVALTLPDPMMDVSNGRLRNTVHNTNGTTTYEWFVTNPINNYAIAVAAGTYAHYTESFNGLKGKLTLDFWPLDYNLEAAHRQFTQARSMLQCFEHWFGPYPWYEDGYKLLEVPNTGMEHQSAVSYGNWYQNGYRKRGSGLGLQWDFHHRARERARMVRQQHHGQGPGRHVGARELRELCRGDLHGMPVRQGAGRGMGNRQETRHW